MYTQHYPPQNDAPLRTVRLTGELGKLYGKEFKLRVRDGAEAMRALCSQLKGMREHLASACERGVEYAVFYDKRNVAETELVEPCGAKTITFRPVPKGKKSGLFQTVLGVALVALALSNPAFLSAQLFTVAGSSVMLGHVVFGVGMTLALGGISQLLSPQPKFDMPNTGETSDNKNFNGPVQLAAHGGIVPIAIGKVMTGSMVISGSIFTQDGKVLSRGVTSAGNPAVGWVGVNEAN